MPVLLSPQTDRRTSLPPRFQSPQTLLIDADDTLWENNVYFERAISGFVAMLKHPDLSDAEVRQQFTAIEQDRVRLHGYGTASFRESMLAAVPHFKGRAASPAESEHILQLTRRIAEAEIELLPGVAETLAYLADRHRVVLMTKGNPAEQSGKLERSGLAPFFHHVEVVVEKHRQAYEDLRAKHRCDAATTWMIGNSPRSDINPALAAGLHAVFLPHPNTWVLEDAAVREAPAGQHLLVLDRFAQLTELF